MRKLLQFFRQHSSLFVYLCYAALCLILLFGFNPYQQSVYFSSASRIAGSLYDLSGAVTGYFGLQKANNELLVQNGKLQNELAVLRNTLAQYQARDTLSQLPFSVVNIDTSRIIVARVINNSVARRNNSITIDKGMRDGVFPEMGLVDQNGVVGVVSSASSGYAVALSLLNPHLRISCKIKNTQQIGSLAWDGKSIHHAELEELPEYITVNVGDTIVTSGYSGAFPEGLVVGYVEDTRKVKKNNFYALTIRLAADFSALNFVRVVEYHKPSEQIYIEEEAQNYE